MAAHAKDLQVQGKYGVKYLKYWFDESTGKAFCMVDAPNKEAAAAVHREAHGLVADEIVEVKEAPNLPSDRGFKTHLTSAMNNNSFSCVCLGRCPTPREGGCHSLMGG